MRVVKFALVGAVLGAPAAVLAQEAKPNVATQALPPVTVVTEPTSKAPKKKVVKKSAPKSQVGTAAGEPDVAAIAGHPHEPNKGGDIALPQSVTASTVGGVLVIDQDVGRVSSVTHQGLTIFGGGAQTSFYQAASILPSVGVESPDPFGLSATRNINVAGKGDFHLTRNINGLPIYGIVGGADLYDLEDIARLDVYRGPIPADKSFGISNATGVIDQIILGPQDQASSFFEESFGSWDFNKVFARFDSGLLSTGTKMFVSASTTDEDKWTGVGGNSRNNAALGWSQKVGEDVKVEVNAVYNDFEGNPYRALTYAQVQTLGAYYYYDYNAKLTGNASTDVNYYKFNRLDARDYALQANIDYRFAPGQHVVFKPYYWNNDSTQYSATGSQVQIWRQENENYGGVLEYKGHFGTGTELAAGYWWQSMAPPPPPTDQRRFTVTATGDLKFASWNTIAKIDDFEVNSPYVQVIQTLGSVTVTGGVRYMSLGAPEMIYYNTAGVTDGSLDHAIATSSGVLADAYVAAKDYNEFLPNVSVSNDFGYGWSGALSYGRNFGRPDWGPQASNYISNRAAFQAKGFDLQDLVDRVRPEIADQYAAQLSYRGYGLTVVPSLFYAEHANKQVKVIDPSIGANVAYYEGTGSSTEYGAELQVAYQFSHQLYAFGSGTLSSETFDSDTATLSGGAKLATKGKQIPNTPQEMLKLGITYVWNGIALTPTFRYIGERYGDAANTQKISGYTATDFTAAYNIQKMFGLEEATLKAGVINMFDKQYVSEISPNDTDLSSTATYYVGAPRTFIGTVAVKF